MDLEIKTKAFDRDLSPHEPLDKLQKLFAERHPEYDILARSNYSSNPMFLSKLMFCGFLPMTIGTGKYPQPIAKSHAQRMLFDLRRPEQLHIQRKAKRRSPKFMITVDKCYAEVLRLTSEQHGRCNWFRDPLVSTIGLLEDLGDEKRIMTSHSVELWVKDGMSEADWKMAAGDLGGVRHNVPLHDGLLQRKEFW
eukprot:Selendium_serpulae@DN4576_c0_g1_i2.p1